MARAYAKVRVDGIDLDPASVQQAQELLTGSGVEDRVEFHCRDAADPRPSGRHDLVTMFESLHDLAGPVNALTAARMLLSPGGCVLVADEKNGQHCALDAGGGAAGTGSRVLHCLPVGIVGDHAAGTGTVIREEMVRTYARDRPASPSASSRRSRTTSGRFYLLTL